MILVSVGTERFPFNRLIQAVDLASDQVKGEPIFVQLGNSTYIPQNCRWTRFLSYPDLVNQIQEARVVVIHAGAGLLLLSLRAGKIPIVVPRRKRFGEHVDDHQKELALRMAQTGNALLSEEPEALAAALRHYEEQVAGLLQVRNQFSGPDLATSLMSLLNS